MIILSLDSSSTKGSVSILQDGKILGEIAFDVKSTHSERLLLIVDFLFQNLKIKACDLDYISVCNGPGSFTGLRIALATAKGLGFEKKTPIIPLSTLEVMAFSAACENHLVIPVLDARMKEIYSAGYIQKANTLSKVIEERNYKPADLIELANNHSSPKIITGDGYYVYRDLFREKLKDWSPVSYPARPLSSFGAIYAWDKLQNGKEYKYDPEIEPYYIRESQAEISRKNKSL